MNTIFRIEQISKKYVGHTSPILDNISFSLHKGKTYCFIGENGAGKTTLLQALAGLTDIDSGKIYFKEELLQGPSSRLVAGHALIKLLKQDATLYPKMTVAENIRYEIKSYPIDYIKQRTKQLIDLCHLEGMENRYPSELSGGQKQKAALARALADEPEVIMLDEPFSNSDIMQKFQLKRTLSEVFKKTQTTVLFSSHDITEALSISDLIICMKGGVIIQIGTPEEIYFKPANLYVANLAGLCNYFEANKLSFVHAPIDTQYACIRAEHVEVCSETEKDFQGTLLEKYFMGSNNEYTVITDHQIKLVFYATTNFEIGTKIYLRLKKEFLIFFSEI